MRYEFEPEFMHSVPRPVPEWYSESRYERRQRRTLFVTAAIGAGCLAFAQTPWVQRLGLYFLPLGYLDIIGGLVLLGACAHVARRLLGYGNLRYLRLGTPLAAQINEITKVPTLYQNGSATRYAFAADVSYLHPVSNETVVQRIMSDDFMADNRDRYTTAVRAGNMVTAVYLGNAPEQGLTLYGFLGLNPQRDFIIDRKEFNKQAHWIKTALEAVVIAALFAFMFANVYAIAFYSPLDFDWPRELPPYAAAGTVITALLLYFSYRAKVAARKKWERQQEEARAAGEPYEVTFESLWEQRGVFALFLKGIIGLGSILLVTLTLICNAFIINAVFDRSAPEHKQVELLQLVKKIEKFIFCEYSIEFRSPYTQEKDSIASEPERLNQLIGPNGELVPATAIIHQGALGWRWVKDIVPSSRRPG